MQHRGLVTASAGNGPGLRQPVWLPFSLVGARCLFWLEAELGGLPNTKNNKTQYNNNYVTVNVAVWGVAVLLPSAWA